MKASYNWLKDYVSFNISPAELADRLTSAGLEIELMISIGDDIKDIIIGEVLDVQKHPNADKLSLCNVDIGNEKLEIVCGASNVAKGQKVPVALVGVQLPNGIKIKKSKIRDVISHGMICSEKELGLSDESLGIMVLPDNVKIGKKFIDEMNVGDTIFEINITPNRPDCLSIIGIAREISCLLRLPLKLSENVLHEECENINSFISVENEAHHLCPRYTTRYIYDAKIEPSPFWLRQRLQSVGIRSINNIVDITNYVLIEYGHPLHAFDARLISGKTIKIRNAKQGEIFETLDGVKRELNQDMLVIADKEKAIALAGIMGGNNSGVKEDTKDIILESAFFDPSNIRNTSKKLDISSESSYRFERGTDYNGLVNASQRAASLMCSLAGAKIVQGSIDNYPVQFQQKKVNLRLEKVNNILGTTLSITEIENILVRLDFQPKKNSEGEVEFIVPSFRPDITREIDLIEEVARIYGYERIKSKVPEIPIMNNFLPESAVIINKIKNILSSCGFNEIVSYSFTDSVQFDKLNLKQDDIKRKAIKIKNPLTPEQSLMRTMLLSGILNIISNNLKHGNLNLKLFEISKVYIPEEGFELPYEEKCISIALTGKFLSGLDYKEIELDFFNLKGYLEILIENLGMENLKFKEYNHPSFHPNKCFSITNSKIPLGFGGELHPDVLENYEFKQPVFAMELSIDKIIALLTNKKKKFFKPFSIFPSIMRDLSLVVRDKVTHEEIINIINESEKKLIEEIRLFDIFKGKTIPDGFKSMGYRIVFRSHECTLKDEEIDKIVKKILDNLSGKLEVELRNK